MSSTSGLCRVRFGRSGTETSTSSDDGVTRTVSCVTDYAQPAVLGPTLSRHPALTGPNVSLSPSEKINLGYLHEPVPGYEAGGFAGGVASSCFGGGSGAGAGGRAVAGSVGGGGGRGVHESAGQEGGAGPGDAAGSGAGEGGGYLPPLGGPGASAGGVDLDAPDPYHRAPVSRTLTTLDILSRGGAGRARRDLDKTYSVPLGPAPEDRTV